MAAAAPPIPRVLMRPVLWVLVLVALLGYAAYAFIHIPTEVLPEFNFPQVGHITISGGFSGADYSVLPQEVINRADAALYAAKDAGRNCICHYETLIKEGILKETPTGSIDLF